MRPLNISPTSPPPVWPPAHELLAHLRDAQPLPLAAFGMDEAPVFRYIISVAKQYQHTNATWAELLTAGYNGLAGAAAAYANRPEKMQDMWTWWVRQEMIKATWK